MEKFFKFIPFVFLVFLIFFIFKSWFSLDLITAGDFWPVSKSQYEDSHFSIYAWNPTQGAGMGAFVGPLLWIYLNIGIPVLLLGKFLGLNWPVVERVYYFFPFLILSLTSSYILFSRLVSKSFALLSSSIFTLNTYILMIVGGGQIIGIGMAYSMLPFVFYILFKQKDELRFSNSLYLGLTLAIITIFDIRISFITFTSILIYSLFKSFYPKFSFSLKLYFYNLFLPLILVVLIHFFWIFPTILNFKNPVEEFGQAYSSLEAVKFFSFAKFENAISLLHPNWPENIFGKVGFLRPEFLILPFLTFFSLLFVRNERKEIKSLILYFSILGLIGAFLAKGANEPFGEIYNFLFQNLPGFMLFRDPSKWYVLVAVSYSILIPFSVWKIYELLPKIFNLQRIFLIFTILYLLLLIRPAFLGQLTGMYRATQIPKEYVSLEKLIDSEDKFFRTLWIPSLQRFGYYSNNHPAITSRNYFETNDISEIVGSLDEKILRESGVKYVIVPYDSQGEIFIKDKKYNEKLYSDTVRAVENISWLKKIDNFGKIVVFEVSNPKDHFYFGNQQSVTNNKRLKYKYISPVEYEVSVQNANVGDTIVFSEGYDARWIAREKGTKLYDWPNLISSNPYNRVFNSFTLRKPGNYILTIYYYPQIFVNFGIVISVLSLISAISLIIYLRRK